MLVVLQKVMETVKYGPFYKLNPSFFFLYYLFALKKIIIINKKTPHLLFSVQQVGTIASKCGDNFLLSLEVCGGGRLLITVIQWADNITGAP